MTDYNDDHHGEDFSQLIKKRKQDKIIKGDWYEPARSFSTRSARL
jgi:hypothetical protein